LRCNIGFCWGNWKEFIGPYLKRYRRVSRTRPAKGRRTLGKRLILMPIFLHRRKESVAPSTVEEYATARAAHTVEDAPLFLPAKIDQANSKSAQAKKYC